MAVSIGEGAKDTGAAERQDGVEEWVMVKLKPFEEGAVVGEVSIPLRVGTFGDCKEGGSLCSHVMICE